MHSCDASWSCSRLCMPGRKVSTPLQAHMVDRLHGDKANQVSNSQAQKHGNGFQGGRGLGHYPPSTEAPFARGAQHGATLIVDQEFGG